MVAGVSISEGSNAVNQMAAYRFTLIPAELAFEAGTIIKTYFPSTIALQLSSTNQITTCQRYNKMTSSISSLDCTYSAEETSVSFNITSDSLFSVAYEYDIGSF